MTSDNIISTILSTIGTVLWCIQLIPQIYFLHKHKDAEGFPPLFMVLWCIAGLFMCIYFVVSDSYIPMHLQPHLFTTFCFIAWIQAMHYPPNLYSWRKIITLGSTFFILWLGFEIGFVIWLRTIYSEGIEWPNIIFGILSTVFICVGLLPPYWELLHRKGRVMGINFLFLAIDSSGAVFSMAAMCLGKFDVLGMILYATMIALELGLFVSQGMWMLRFGREKEQVEEVEVDVGVESVKS